MSATTTIGGRPEWTLSLVTEETRSLLERLFELYLYDFSEMEHADVADDGLFRPPAPPWIARFIGQPRRHAFVMRVAGKPAGLVLLDEQSPMPESAHRCYLAAFFVMRAYRRRGLGAAVARHLFDRFPGPWQVLEVAANPTAQHFWRGIIGAYTGGRYTERWLNEREIVQEFDTADKVEP
jgi:predicted acetyltransferase